MRFLNKKDKTNIGILKYFLLLHILIAFNSFSGVCSKLAAQNEFLSLRFCLLYGCVILILFVYAIVWQQILKHIPLTTAFCNKAIGIVWGITWGVLIFKEQIKLNMLIGAAIVILGVIIVVKSDNTSKNNGDIGEVSADEH